MSSELFGFGFTNPTSTDWQSWVDGLIQVMPHGATVDEVDTVFNSVKTALRAKGYNIL
jgi:hypothetical protein